MREVYQAIVIGAGCNGLVAAAYLARAGLRVLVLERRQAPGGAAATEEPVVGFRFDTCPDAAGRLHPLVVRDLRLGESALEPLQGAPTLTALQPDGPPLLLWRDIARSVEALRAFAPADADRLGAFAAFLHRLTGWLDRVYLDSPPRPVGGGRADLTTLLRLGLRLRRLGAKDMYRALRVLPMSVAGFLDEWFAHPLLKGALAPAGVIGLSHGPLAAGTAYGLLHHLRPGEFFPPMTLARGGIGRVGEALAASARRFGAEVRTGNGAAQVLVGDGRAEGVLLEDGEEIRAPVVASSADPRRTYFQLVGPRRLDPAVTLAVRNLKYRGQCARINLALDGPPQFRGLGAEERALAGRIIICPSIEYLERASDEAKYGAPSRRPALDVIIPSLTDPSVAPPGKHVMSVSVHYAPYHLREGDWDTRREVLGSTVIETLAGYAPNLKNILLHAQVFTPLDLERMYGLTEGHIYHGEQTLDQLFFLRPLPGWAQYRTPIGGLYLCGAGTHPGGGLTGLPGRNAARQILHDLKERMDQR